MNPLDRLGSELSMPSGHFADPALVAFGDRYFLYPTTDGLDDWGADSFRAFSSANLSQWEDHGVIFSLPDQTVWATRFAWAPTVAARNGRYYLYFTAESSIGVAVGDSPLGPFTDLGRPLVARGEFPGAAIDPSIFVDLDDSPYLLWGNTTLNMVRLNEDMVSFERSTLTSWQPTAFREAAWMHERGGIYYLSWSENDTRDEDYRVRYATAGSVFGPWTDRGLLLVKDGENGILATGHHSVLRIPGSDDWVIAYHYFEPGGTGYNRRLAIAPLNFEADGTMRPVVPMRGAACAAAPSPHKRGMQ